jgi:hypothetical protein
MVSGNKRERLFAKYSVDKQITIRNQRIASDTGEPPRG